eukprot:TRINITY_DN11111_c1_g4_i1.p1 TRINITY_DN11111_c1_g4~~TRINITY_DN11111_c1_g4_i1.p1  ORF type:complete len:1275 (-),score=225.78 TRINITY_DN11111_c1_g4_i1:64-3888(-)
MLDNSAANVKIDIEESADDGKKDVAKAKGADNKEDTTEAVPKPVSFYKLLTFASPGELVLFLVSCLAGVGLGGSQLIMVVYFGDIVHEMATNAAVAVNQMVLAFIYIGCGAFVFGCIQVSFSGIFAESQRKRFISAYVEAVLRQDIGWFDVRKAGTLAERINSNIDNMVRGVGDQMSLITMNVTMMLGGIILAFVYWWDLTLIVCAAIPLMSIGVAAMGKAMADGQGESQSSYIEAGHTAEEVFFALRTVFAFRGENIELARYREKLRVAWWGGLKTQLILGTGMGYMQLCMFAANGVAFWYAATRIAKAATSASTGEELTPADMLKAFFNILFAGFGMGMIGEPYQVISNACSAGGSFFEVLNSTPSIEGMTSRDGNFSETTVTSIESITFEQVVFHYPTRPDVTILKGVNLTITSGQQVALVGESGSGKSTIVALIERFYDATAGRVLINGSDLTTLRVADVRRHIGYVGQEPVLFATSIRNNIMQGFRDAGDERLDLVRVQADLSFITNLPQGMETFVGSGGSQFSGGQKQRIALARALIRKPSVLLLDEATSALDNKSEKLVQETLDNLKKHTPITSISIAHRLSTVRNCDVIYVMKQGVVVEFGRHSDLIAKQGEYFSLVASQKSAETQREARLIDVDEYQNCNNPSVSDRKELNTDVGTQEAPEEEMDEEEKEKLRIRRLGKTYKVPMVRLLRFARPAWWHFIPGSVGALMFGAKEPLQGVILFELLAKFYIPDRDEMLEEVSKGCLWFIALAVGSQIGGILQFGCFGAITQELCMGLRTSLMKHMLRMEVGFHDDPANTPSKLVYALETYGFRSGTMMQSFGGYANVFGALVVGIALGLWKSWQMTLIAVCFVPAMAIAQYVAMKMMMIGQGSDDSSKAVQQIISDAVNNMRTVRSLQAEGSVLTLVNRLTLASSSKGKLKALTGGLSAGLSQCMVFFIFGVAFKAAFWLMEEGVSNFVDVMTALNGILFGAMGIGQAAPLFANIGLAKAACHDLFKLFDRPSLIDGLEPSGIVPAEDLSKSIGRLEFENVFFDYPFRPDVRILQGVSFVVEHGQSVGLCGPSGGGKSTMFALLQRFYDPREGRILISSARTPLNSVSIAWWRSKVGYVGQEPILFDTTVRENVNYGGNLPPVSDELLAECGRMANLGFLEDKEGWDTKVGPRGSALSGGQKQRVAICRALVRSPPIMLFDEATSALDTASEQIVQEALDAVKQDRTSFTIAHRLTTIEKCDLLLVCSEGRVVEQGTHDKLMSYASVYKTLRDAAAS